MGLKTSTYIMKTTTFLRHPFASGARKECGLLSCNSEGCYRSRARLFRRLSRLHDLYLPWLASKDVGRNEEDRYLSVLGLFWYSRSRSVVCHSALHNPLWDQWAAKCSGLRSAVLHKHSEPFCGVSRVVRMDAYWLHSPDKPTEEGK